MKILQMLLAFVRNWFVSRGELVVENLALRQQLLVLRRTAKQPRLRWSDRFFWVALSRLWQRWTDVLVIVKPDTVVRWHRAGFRLYWRWKSRPRPGRPAIDRAVIGLIQRMCRENPTWGAPRIQAELARLGHALADSTVAKYMLRCHPSPSQTWRTFLTNHVGSLAACDFFVVPTVTFHWLYVFVVLRHDRRHIVHFHTTRYPTAAWVSQQLREAFPFDKAPRYLLHDRDGVYGDEFHRTAAALLIEEVVSAPQSPWQNPYCERFIGSIRRDCLDHVIVFNEHHLRRILSVYFTYYLTARCHRALDRHSPVARSVEPPSQGKRVIAIPHVGGLHHRYARCA
jgi:putative transposase